MTTPSRWPSRLCHATDLSLPEGAFAMVLFDILARPGFRRCRISTPVAQSERNGRLFEKNHTNLLKLEKNHMKAAF